MAFLTPLGLSFDIKVSNANLGISFLSTLIGNFCE